MSLEEKYSKFNSCFEKNSKTRLQEYVFEPCRQDNGKRNWTNNNAESLNNILKLAVDWKPQCTNEFIENIHSVTELYFLDYRCALHDSGNYRLARKEYAYNVNDALWRCKSDDEKEELFLNFLKDSMKRKREALVTSNDGKFSVKRLKLWQEKPLSTSDPETRGREKDKVRAVIALLSPSDYSLFIIPTLF